MSIEESEHQNKFLGICHAFKSTENEGSEISFKPWTDLIRATSRLCNDMHDKFHIITKSGSLTKVESGGYQPEVVVAKWVVFSIDTGPSYTY